MTGRILVWDPPNVLEHEWKQPIVEDGVVRYELTADGDGTLLRFTHRGLGVRNAQRIPAAERTPFLIAWKPIWPATNCPWGRRRLEVIDSNSSRNEQR